jgi:hypothetical protein
MGNGSKKTAPPPHGLPAWQDAQWQITIAFGEGFWCNEHGEDGGGVGARPKNAKNLNTCMTETINLAAALIQLFAQLLDLWNQRSSRSRSR